MKILVVSPTPSHPPTAGNRRRIQALATALRERGAHLSFLYYAREDIDSRTYNDLKSFWDEFYLVQTGQMYTPPPADHFRVDDWVTRPLSETFLSTVREKEFDAVIINYVMLSSLSELVDDRTLTILDTHDVFAGRDEMLRGMGRKPDFFWTSLEEEAKGLVRQDVVLAIQNREAEYFKTAANEVLLVGHMEPQRPYKGGVRDDIPTFGIIGSRNQVNSHFIGELASNWASSGEGILKIVGGICLDPHLIERASNCPNIELCGAVDETETFYASVDVCVNPICVGTGLKIKTVEALAAGVPVIGTQEGFAGLPASSDFHQLSDSSELVKACNRYVHDIAFREEVRTSSAAVADAYHAAVTAQVDELVDRIRKHMVTIKA